RIAREFELSSVYPEKYTDDNGLAKDVAIMNNDRVTFFFSSRRRHTRFSRDWSSDVCSSDLAPRVRVHRGPDIARLVLYARKLHRVLVSVRAIETGDELDRPAGLVPHDSRNPEQRRADLYA